MYFPVLEMLRTCEGFEDHNIALYDTILYLIYDQKLYPRFHPKIYKKLGVPIEEDKWFNLLNHLSNHGYLRINFELCCSESFETIQTFKKYDDIPIGIDIVCPNCGNEFRAEEKDIFITYTFNDIFRPLSGSGRDLSFFRKGPQTLDDSISLDHYKMYPNIIYDMIIQSRRVSLTKIIDKLPQVDNNKRKGRLYELLARKILESYYLEIFKKGTVNRYSTGQVDILFHVKKLEGTIFQEFSDIMVIECKNWGDPANVKEIRDLSGKLTNFKSNIGMMFARKGVTGKKKASASRDGLEEIKNIWNSQGKIILVITLQDVIDILRGTNVYKLLENRYLSTKTL